TTRPAISPRSRKSSRAAPPAPRRWSRPSTRAGAARSNRCSSNSPIESGAIALRSLGSTTRENAMSSLFDMLTSAQNGQAIQQMARQFGLSQQQVEAALEALLPAFSQGLKRNASNPYDLGSFLQALASGQHARYFEDATNAFSPQGVAEGNGIL